MSATSKKRKSLKDSKAEVPTESVENNNSKKASSKKSKVEETDEQRHARELEEFRVNIWEAGVLNDGTDPNNPARVYVDGIFDLL